MALYINAPVSRMADYDGWFARQVGLMQGVVPALTNFVNVKVGDFAFGTLLATAATDDATQVGGGEGNPATNSKVFAASLFQTPKTTAWAVAYRAIIPAPVSGKYNLLGITNGANTREVGIGSIFASSATNYVFRAHNGASETVVDSTVAIDGLIHDFILTFDGTTQRCFKDGTQITSNTTLTHVFDVPMFPHVYGDDAAANKVVRFGYGYIAP